jgi:hypothetical protein
MHMKGTMEGSCMRIRVNNCTYGSISAISYVKEPRIWKIIASGYQEQESCRLLLIERNKEYVCVHC